MQRGSRGDADDPTICARPHVRQHRTDRGVCRHDVLLEQRADRLHIRVRDRAGGEATCQRGQRVDASEATHDGFGEARHRRLVAEVGGFEPQPLAGAGEGLAYLLDPRPVPVRSGDVCPALKERCDNGVPQVSGRSGDDHDLAAEVVHATEVCMTRARTRTAASAPTTRQKKRSGVIADQNSPPCWNAKAYSSHGPAVWMTATAPSRGRRARDAAMTSRTTATGSSRCSWSYDQPRCATKSETGTVAASRRIGSGRRTRHHTSSAPVAVATSTVGGIVATARSNVQAVALLTAEDCRLVAMASHSADQPGRSANEIATSGITITSQPWTSRRRSREAMKKATNTNANACGFTISSPKSAPVSRSRPLHAAVAAAVSSANSSAVMFPPMSASQLGWNDTASPARTAVLRRRSVTRT